MDELVEILIDTIEKHKLYAAAREKGFSAYHCWYEREELSNASNALKEALSVLIADEVKKQLGSGCYCIICHTDCSFAANTTIPTENRHVD